jgi:hypothetical protein
MLAKVVASDRGEDESFQRSRTGGHAMGSHQARHLTKPPPFQAQSLHPHADDMSLLELREENEQLRDLVIQLSRIVVKNAVERK